MKSSAKAGKLGVSVSALAMLLQISRVLGRDQAAARTIIYDLTPQSFQQGYNRLRGRV